MSALDDLRKMLEDVAAGKQQVDRPVAEWRLLLHKMGLLQWSTMERDVELTDAGRALLEALRDKQRLDALEQCYTIGSGGHSPATWFAMGNPLTSDLIMAQGTDLRALADNILEADPAAADALIAQAKGEVDAPHECEIGGCDRPHCTVCRHWQKYEPDPDAGHPLEQLPDLEGLEEQA